jgi:hypothetical protein
LFECYSVIKYVEQVIKDREKTESCKFKYRLFLSSARTYKNYIALDSNLLDAYKDLIINLPFSKFCWGVELYTNSFDSATGLILIDCTTNNTTALFFGTHHSVFAITNGMIYDSTGESTIYPIFPNFIPFSHNLD